MKIIIRENPNASGYTLDYWEGIHECTPTTLQRIFETVNEAKQAVARLESMPVLWGGPDDDADGDVVTVGTFR